MQKFGVLAALFCCVVTAQAAKAVKPTFTSTPSLAASEGVPYSYTVTASTPDNEAVTFTLRGPADAVFTGNTVKWTPSSKEARRSITFIITATSASGGKASQNFKIVATGTVSGTRIDHFLKAIAIPEDLSGTVVAAYVPNGAGGYTVIPGTGTSSGTYSIDKVPGGFYLLQLGKFYLFTSNSTVHVDPYADTRPNPAQADPSTTVTFDLTNISQWQTTDVLEMFAANNATYLTFDEAKGAKTFSGTYEYDGALSDGSQGDRYFVTHLITQPLGGTDFVALGRHIVIPPFMQADGSDTPIAGAMLADAQTQQFEANVNAGDMTKAAMAVNAKGQLTDTSVFLDAFPGTLANGIATASPDLVGYSLGNGSPFLSSNADLGPVFYGNPFPASWPLYTGYIWSVNVPYVAPGATSSTTLFGSAFGFGTTLPTSTEPLELLISGPTSPTVNGKSFSGKLTGIGVTPQLAWGAPTTGTASYYQLFLWRLSKNGTASAVTLEATLQTPSTSLTLPPGLLVSGDTYVFDLWAYTVDSFSALQPLRPRLPYGAADVMSELMQP